MAKSPAEQIKDLTAAFAELSAKVQVLASRFDDLGKDVDWCVQQITELLAKFAAHDVRLSQLDKVDEQLRNEQNALRDELRRALDRLAVSEAKNASLEERSRHHEKSTDCGWQLWLAALGFGFGLISLLVTAALQLKK